MAIDASDEYAIPVAARMHRLPPYLFGRLNKIKYDKRRAGVDIIDLGMGNPTGATPAPIVDKLAEAVQDPRNHRYSVSVGILNLRREVALRYKSRCGVTLDANDEVVACIGSKEGFSHMCLAMLGPGDTALVPAPAFPIHVYAVAITGANVISIPLVDGPAMVSEIAHACERIYPRPKVLVLNYPHNPTTATVDLAFFEEVVALAKRFDFYILQDYAYGETVFDGYRAPSILEVPGAKDRAVEFSTLSKQFNMAGWRLGFAVGNAEMLRALAKIKGYYDYGIFQPIQIGAIIAMRHCNAEAEAMARVYEARRDVLCEGLERAGWEVRRPRATMFVWARMPERYQAQGSIDFAVELIEKAEVAAAPGRGFGEAGEGYFRFSLVENEQRLRQACRQIARAFKP